MKRFGGFIAVTVAVCGLGAWIIVRTVPGTDVARSVWASAAAVVLVQGAAFAIVRIMQPVNVIAGWGLGMLLRFLALLLFGVFGVKALGLNLEPALLSMAAFFFVSTVIEPVFLKP